MTSRPAAAAGRRRVVRAPNHLGDVVMALPALAEHGGDVVVRRGLAPLLEMAGHSGRVIPLDPGVAGWLHAVGALREGGYGEGVLLTPSFGSAWLFRCAGVGRLRGTGTDGRGWLLADRVPREALGGRHRTLQYRFLLGQDPGDSLAAPALVPPSDVRERWRARVGEGGPLVGLVPGSNAPARRWPEERFTGLARALLAEGCRVVIVGGPPEVALTARIAAGAPGSRDEGGRTDLPGLAALLALCDVVVTNDTGPMHLAAAVGAPTVTLWGPSDPAEVAPVWGRQARVAGPDLPCRPCFKNHCLRSGAGTMLRDAHEECMNLIEVEAVLGTVRGMLDGGGP
jgi:heptosyltransferase-2